MSSNTVRDSRNWLKKILASDRAYATTLLTILIDHFGDEALKWHPTTRRMELEQTFGVDLPVINGDKLNAGIMLLTSDGFFKRESVFVQICNVLSGTPFAYADFDRADVDECAWGITEAMLLAAPEEEEPFSDEIRGYIGKVLKDEGIKTPPDVLRLGTWDEQQDYSGMSIEDPVMFSGEFQMQADESKEIERILQLRLKELLAQLESLPLEDGNNKDLASRLRGNLRS